MGFRSPLILLGLGAAPVTTQGGFKSPLPTWNAGAVVGAEQGGFISPLPMFHLGGGVGTAEIDYVTGGHGHKPRPWRNKERVVQRRTRQLLKFIEDFKKRPLPSEVIPEEVSPLAREALLTGKVVVGDVEVRLGITPTIPVHPLSVSAPDIIEIVDPLDKEIAELIRARALSDYLAQLQEFQDEVFKFEEEFLMLLILMTE